MSVRVYDIPHYTSRLVVFQAISEAPLSIDPILGGVYTFPDTWESMTLPANLKRGIYIPRTLQFGADVNELDWQSSWSARPPVIRWAQTATGLSPQMRDPIPLVKYSDGAEFIETIVCDQDPSELKFRITGTLLATPSLAGKTRIRATVALYAYEITDDDFVRKYKEIYRAQ